MGRRSDPREEQLRQQARAAHRRGSYLPGHSIHWIQARKAAETLGEAEVGTVVAVDRRGIHVEVDGEFRRYGVNDRERVATLLAEHGPEVRIQHRWAVLWIGHRYLISIRGPLPGSGPSATPSKG